MRISSLFIFLLVSFGLFVFEEGCINISIKSSINLRKGKSDTKAKNKSDKNTKSTRGHKFVSYALLSRFMSNWNTFSTYTSSCVFFLTLCMLFVNHGIPNKPIQKINPLVFLKSILIMCCAIFSRIYSIRLWHF